MSNQPIYRPTQPGDNTPREIVVFVSYENARAPLEIARAMIEAAQVGRVSVGEDLLTGGVEVRLFYDLMVLARLEAWLDAEEVSYDISFL